MLQKVLEAFARANAVFQEKKQVGKIHAAYFVVGYDVANDGEVCVVAESGDGNVSSPGYATRRFRVGVFLAADKKLSAAPSAGFNRGTYGPH